MPDPTHFTDPISIFEEIFPGDTNAYGTAFGGRILALMDRAAGLAASRYAHCHFVTASLDTITFRAPVRLGETVEVEARVVYTSSRTCGVKVRVHAIEMTRWDRRPCCEGTLFMVAIGPDGRPTTIPALTPVTDEERQSWDEAKALHERLRRSPA
jgi:acyl-CoA hydrolase